MDNQFTLFKVEDINSIIKIFAYNIQDKIQQIDRTYHSHELTDHKSDQSLYYIRKYKGYITSVPEQTKYVEKMVSRIIQILKFFKQRSKNQCLIEVVISKIQQKLMKMLSFKEMDLGKIITFILNISLYGFNMSGSFIQHKKYSVSRSSKKAMLASNENSQATSQFQEQIFKRRKTASLCWRKDKVKTQPKIVVPTKQQNEKYLHSMYSIIDIDVSSITRNIENKQKMEKDCLRCNTSILNTHKNYEKEYSRKRREKQQNPLKELKNKQSFQPVMNNWVSRKRKMVSQKRKRELENVHIIS